jgi:hypothetical protein
MKEDPVTGLRRELRLSGYPQPRDAFRLADHLSPALRVDYRPITRGFSVRTAGRAFIRLPERLTEEAAAEILLEEVMHYLAEPAGPPECDLRTPEALRLHLLAQDRDEGRARALVLAWKLPLDLVLAADDDEELAAESGCTLEEVAERRRALLAEISR